MRPARRPCLLWALPALSLLTSCANPAPPRPPSLNLPAPVLDLRAERVGDAVRLSWTTPAQTTDGLAVRGPMTAEICRDAPEPRPTSPACTAVLRLPAAPGPGTGVDSLPPALLADPPGARAYRVRLLNAAGRAAEPTSPPALAPTGAAPAAVADLRASLVPGAVALTWSPSAEPAAEVQLLRTAAASPPSGGSPPAQPAGMSAQAPGGRTASGRKSPFAPARPADSVRLLAARGGDDRGTALDATAKPGAGYTYSAVRVRTVMVDGHELTLRSPESPGVAIAVRDIAPPASPSGLEAVMDGGAVDLSWEPGAEPDLAGYMVERATGSALECSALPSSVWTRMNAVPLIAPAFRDASPPAEGRLCYRVSAIDTSGNRSRPGEPVSARGQR